RESFLIVMDSSNGLNYFFRNWLSRIIANIRQGRKPCRKDLELQWQASVLQNPERKRGEATLKLSFATGRYRSRFCNDYPKRCRTNACHRPPNNVLRRPRF